MKADDPVQTAVDVSMSVIGYLMYGNATMDEISTNILKTEGYSEALKVVVLINITIIAITKFPLKWETFHTTYIAMETTLTRVQLYPDRIYPGGVGRGGSSRRYDQAKSTQSIPLPVNTAQDGVPYRSHDCDCHDCDRGAFFRSHIGGYVFEAGIDIEGLRTLTCMSVMGAGACFLICVAMPAIFHLKMFHGRISKWQLALDWCLIVLSLILGTVGTVWEFLPRGWMGL